MSQSIISWRKVRQLNRATSERFVHASTRDTNVWHAVRHDGTAAWVFIFRIKHVGRVFILEPDPNPERWGSCGTLRNRTPGEFLTEMDRRATEL